MNCVPVKFTAEHVPTNKFGQLKGCSLTFSGGKAFITGGKDAWSTDNSDPIMFISTHSLDLKTMTWDRVEADFGAVPNRVGHLSVSLNNQLFIFGGQAVSSNEVLGEPAVATVHVSDGEVGLKWSAIDVPLGKPDAIEPPRLCWSCGDVGKKASQGSFMVVFGGQTELEEDGFNSDVFILDELDITGRATWHKPGMVGTCPSGRIHASAEIVPSGRHFVMVGGFDGAQFLEEVWVLDVDGWCQYQAPNAMEEASHTEKKGGKKGATGPPEVCWSQVEFTAPAPSNMMAPKITVATCNGEGFLLVSPGGGGGMMVAALPGSLMGGGAGGGGGADKKKKKGGAPDGDWKEVEWSALDLSFCWPCSPKDPLLCFIPLETANAAEPERSEKSDSGGSPKEKSTKSPPNRPPSPPLKKESSMDQEPELPLPPEPINDIAEGLFSCVALDTSGDSDMKAWWLNFASANCPELSDPNERHVERDIEIGVDLGWGREETTGGDVFEGQLIAGKREGQGVLSCANGDVYTGWFKAGHRCGQGKSVYKNTGVYEGQWLNDLREGQGVMKYEPEVPEDTYEGEWHLDKRHGKGKCRYKNGDTFDGEWIEDHQAGEGKCGYGDDGGWYEGEWLNGLPHGQGKLMNGKGDLYIGAFVKGKQEGEGQCNYADGRDYDGQWKAGKRNGNGRCVYGNGDIFNGKWRADKRCGKGYMEFANGNLHTGIWANDLREGEGVCEYANGDRYEGNWSKDRRHGRGSCWYSTGGFYSGDWKDDLRCGAGEGYFEVEEHPDGLTGDYKGQWDRGLPEGEGVFNFTGGDCYEGRLYRGTMHGRGKMRYADDSVYVGEWLKGKHHGEGAFTSVREDGEVQYDGQWRDGIRHGTGRAEYKDGAVYEGQWRNDCRNGHGSCAYANGDVYEGQWEGGTRSGLGTLTYSEGGSYDGEWINDRPEVPDDHWRGGDHASSQASRFLEKKSQGIFKKISGKSKVGISG